MSGTGHTPGAPAFLTPIAPDQPIGRDADGRDVGATMYFAQMIQRILSFLGQPVQGTGGAGGLTVSEQLTNLQTELAALRGAPDSAAIGLSGRVAELEAALRLLFFRPEHERGAVPRWLPPPIVRQVRAWFPGPAPSVRPSWFPAPQSTAAQISVPLSWLPLQNPNNLVLFTAPAPMVVRSIAGRLEIAQGAAATLTLVKAASGTALSAGTALHTGPFNANGAPATNQTLTLAAFATVALATGDSIGAQTTGTWTTSTGCITVEIYKPG